MAVRASRTETQSDHTTQTQLGTAARRRPKCGSPPFCLVLGRTAAVERALVEFAVWEHRVEEDGVALDRLHSNPAVTVTAATDGAALIATRFGNGTRRAGCRGDRRVNSQMTGRASSKMTRTGKQGWVSSNEAIGSDVPKLQMAAFERQLKGTSGVSGVRRSGQAAGGGGTGNRSSRACTQRQRY